MSRDARREALKQVHPRVLKRAVLADLDREYTLDEIAIITRAAPARLLGLKNKGHLGLGADGDVTIYTPNENKEVMFSMPRMLIKAGRVIVEDGEIRDEAEGRTLHVAPEYDPAVVPDIEAWFEQYYTIQFANYPVDDSYLPHGERVPCQGLDSPST